MRLAVNYSKPLLQLIKHNPNLPIDYIKVPVWPFPLCWSQFRKGVKYRNLLPHPAQTGILAIGHMDPKKRFNPTKVQKILQMTNPPYLSTNIQAKVTQFPEFACYQHANYPELKTAVRERLVQTVTIIQDTIKLPLVLENYPYYSWGGRNLKVGAEPQFISEICDATDCGFLLDLPHAKVSAWYLKRNVMDYIMGLPLHRLIEIHIAGTKYAPGVGIWDSNTVLEDEDYQLLEFVLKQSQPKIITIEYGGYPNFQIDPLNRKIVPCLRNNSNELREMINCILIIIKGIDNGKQSESKN